MSSAGAALTEIAIQKVTPFAPGSTFGPGGEGHLRMCFLRDPAKLEEALDRFGQWLRTNRPA